MKIFFARSAWRKVIKEATKWYQRGVVEKKKPFESIVFPLTAVFLQPGVDKTPLELITVSDVISVAVAKVAIPPDTIKNYSAIRANFRTKLNGLDGLYERFIEQKILAAIERFPLLEVISRLHTHPFAKMTGHSGGDLATIRSDDVRARAKGFGFSLSFILTGEKQGLKTRWDMSGYLVGHDGKEEKLDIELVGGDHALICSALSQPYYKYGIGQRWEEELEAKLKSACLRVSKERMSRGWTSYWLNRGGVENIVCLPPDFPVKEAINYYSSSGKDFQRRKLNIQVSRISEIDPGLMINSILRIP